MVAVSTGLFLPSDSDSAFSPPMNHDIRLVRLDPRQMAQITIVVRCGGIRKLRLRLAMALMRIAGRLGGFKQVKLVRETR